jgi:hypothetical protein
VQGGDTNVAWTLTGTGFMTGASITTPLAGATIANVNVVSATQITFTLSAAGSTGAELTQVTVTNPDMTTASRAVPCVPQTVTLSAEVQPVFTAHCAACHSGGAPAAGLSLVAGVTFGATVGVASTQVPVLSLITAGNPDASYLVDKIEGTHTVGAIMPPSGSMGAVDRMLVRKWAEAGALNN